MDNDFTILDKIKHHNDGKGKHCSHDVSIYGIKGYGENRAEALRVLKAQADRLIFRLSRIDEHEIISTDWAGNPILKKEQ
ncbi:MAG: hypothetical protein IMF01_09530 [Proteobacteria bacterium]|nr:hypothetical protein [Pseudomonadota bacterium]